MKKSKRKKGLQQTEYTQHSTLGLNDSKLTTTIFLGNDDQGPIVLIRFADFDNQEQAEDFVNTFKDHKNFQELESEQINITLH